jgi:hypothetical protein
MVEASIRDSLNTIGFHEAACKDSFKVGIQVAMEKIIPRIEHELVIDRIGLHRFNTNYLDAQDKLNTLGRILGEYIPKAEA